MLSKNIRKIPGCGRRSPGGGGAQRKSNPQGKNNGWVISCEGRAAQRGVVPKLFGTSSPGEVLAESQILRVPFPHPQRKVQSPRGSHSGMSDLLGGGGGGPSGGLSPNVWRLVERATAQRLEVVKKVNNQ
jgi:hypothetical protein